MEERRGHPRHKMYVGVFITRGETAYLAELTNVSEGGVNVSRPASWQADPGGSYFLYFVLDQERILCLKAQVAHEQEETVGFEFDPEYSIQAEQLLAESHNWR